MVDYPGGTEGVLSALKLRIEYHSGVRMVMFDGLPQYIDRILYSRGARVSVGL